MKGFNRPYIKDVNSYFTPIYRPSESYSFYMNLDLTTADSSDFGLWLIDINANQLKYLGDMSKVYTGGTVAYDLYINNFVFPTNDTSGAYIADGQYYFQIWNNTTNIEACRSNIIQASSNCLDTTSYVRFRHNDQLYGYRYDLLPNFYNVFRLPINQINTVDVKSTREQYRQSSNGRELRNSKSFRDLVLTLEFYWADDDDFEAVSAMLEHTDIYIAENRIISMEQVKVEKPMFQSKLSKGMFNVIVDEEQYMENLVLVGGTRFSETQYIYNGN